MITSNVSPKGFRFNNKTTLNLWFDALLLVTVVATVITAFLNKQLHIWFGLATIPTLLVHLLLHWELIEALLKRLWQRKLRFRWKWLLDVVMLLVFIPMILSGMVVSLIYAPQVSRFHEQSFYVFALLVLIHLYTSRKWIAHKLGHGWKQIFRLTLRRV